MINIVHVTPHLGGGVGKAVSGLILANKKDGHQFNHVVIALEALEKKQSLEALIDAGVVVHEKPTPQHMKSLLQSADIIQIEFWNHPLIPELLCSPDFPWARMVFWCHISGLDTPCIPHGIIEKSHQFIFTSACSLSSSAMRNISEEIRGKVGVISSGGGLEELPLLNRDYSLSLRYGYFGSLNFSKMHPEYIRYVDAIQDPLLQISMVGDELNTDTLKNELKKIAKPNLLKFIGYQSDIVKVLMSMDVLIYLLNPTHYGTAENALLEAMAMGVIPIVLNNGAEKELIKHGETGFIVNTPDELSDVARKIRVDPNLRQLMSKSAINYARKNFTYSESIKKFNAVYQKIMLQEKERFDYRSVFGSKPCEWFLSYQADPDQYANNGFVNLSAGHAKYAALEMTKGSAFHFFKYYSNDAMLSKWSNSLTEIGNAPR